MLQWRTAGKKPRCKNQAMRMKVVVLRCHRKGDETLFAVGPDRNGASVVAIAWVV